MNEVVPTKVALEEEVLEGEILQADQTVETVNRLGLPQIKQACRTQRLPLLLQHPLMEVRKYLHVLGKRRVWGTLKACSHTTVKHALDQLVPALKGKLEVKRKYKKLRDNRICRWHVISGAEKDLEDLQKSWEVVHIQTRWKLESCLMDADQNFLGQASSQQTPT